MKGRHAETMQMPGRAAEGTAIPLTLKLSFTAWVIVWAGAYLPYYGPAHFLWLCNLANFILLAGLWLESPLLVSSQAVSVLVIQIVWSLDFLGRLVLGFHPFGATLYMFAATIPLGLRILSGYHIAMPFLLLLAIRRTGYDARGWRLQCLITWLVLPACFLFTDPERNINWLARPFEREQTLMRPWIFLLVMMVLQPLVLYLPAHLLLGWWAGGTSSGGASRGARPWFR